MCIRDRVYSEWSKTQQSLGYIFKDKITDLLDNNELEDLFDCSSGHPLLLRKYLSGELNLEILVIFEHIFNFVKDFDKKLSDPVWETVSMKIRKYIPFININVFQYKKVLRELL